MEWIPVYQTVRNNYFKKKISEYEITSNALSFDKRLEKDSLLNGKQSSFSHESLKGTDKQPEIIDKMSTKDIENTDFM